MCILEWGKPSALKLSYTIEHRECLLGIRETCSDIINIFFCLSLILWSWFPYNQSAGLMPNLSPHCLMYFLSALCAGKNSKLLIHTEANISKSRANWFRYHSLKLANWLRKYSVKVGLFPFLFLFPEKASWALWRNSSDFWSSSETLWNRLSIGCNCCGPMFCQANSAPI